MPRSWVQFPGNAWNEGMKYVFNANSCFEWKRLPKACINLQQKYFLVVKSYAFDCKLLCLVIMTVSHQPRDRFCIRQCETYFAVNKDIPHRKDHPAGMGHSVPLVSHWSPSRWRSLRFHFLIWNETHTATKFTVNFNLLTSPGCKLVISEKKYIF